MHLLPLGKVNTSALPDKNIWFLLWVVRALGLLNKFIQKYCYLDVSQLTTDIQGLYFGIVYNFFTVAANKVINYQDRKSVV